MRKILVVDDEARMRKMLKDYLARYEFEVLEASNGKEAVDLFFEEQGISLILLDVMMPIMDGMQAARAIREYSEVPIIMLTAKSEEADELTGFSNGVDEYVTKPFSLRTLLARIEAILRRTEGSKEGKVIEKGGIRVDTSAHTVVVDERELDLSFKEFELLLYFLENEGIVLTREKILNNVWNFDYIGNARTIDTHVKKLRSKLGEKGEQIHTIWGLGYKFET